MIIDNEKLPAGYKQTEIGLIPEDWEVLSLGEFLTFQNGVNADKSFYGHGIPFINISEVMAHTHLNASDVPGLVSLSKQATDLYRVYRGDILFNRTSEVQEELGLTSVYLDNEIVVFGGFVIRGRQKTETLDIIYSAYALRSPSIRTQITSRGQGVVRANIGQKDLSEIQICVPPLPEQRSISQALSDVDALIAALDKAIAKKRHLKTATMQQLLTGKKRLPGFGEGKGYQKTGIGVIPEDWDVRQICEIADIDPENLGSTTHQEYRFKYISLEDVNRGVLTGYSEQIFSSSPSRARRVLRYGDVLLSTVRPNLKSHLIFREDDDNWICSTGFAVLRCKEGLSIADFLFPHLFSGNIDKQIETLIAGSNYPAINSGDVRKLQLQLPYIEEQHAIATVLSDMDAEIAALETRLAKTQALKQGMMQALLTGKVRLKIEA